MAIEAALVRRAAALTRYRKLEASLDEQLGVSLPVDHEVDGSLNRPRPDAALAFLDALGAGALPESTKGELAEAAAELAKREARFQCQALFTHDGHGIALGVQVNEEEHGQFLGFNQADGEMLS